jgi:hypothetical protein
VVVLDYSCADEAVAKLIQRYGPEERPADVYFLARGLHEQHRHPIEEVLMRHGLALTAEVEGEFMLLGSASELECSVWNRLRELGSGTAATMAGHAGATEAQVAVVLDSLARQRVVLRRDSPLSYVSLLTLLDDPY